MPSNGLDSACPQLNGCSDRSSFSVCAVGGGDSSDGFTIKNHDDDARGDELKLVNKDEKPIFTEEDGEEKRKLEVRADEEEEVKNEEDDSKIGLDTGYAWFVVLGAFISWALGISMMRGGGIFFLQFKDHFETNALTAAWPGSIMSTLHSLCGPFVSAVCNRLSVRTAVMIGAAMTVAGLILNSLVDSFPFLFFCHSFLQGVGTGFVLSPSLFIITAYFDKHRGFASSLASSGACVGSFAILPLLVLLFDVYGFHGCFLVLAGLMSNLFVVAMLFRPLRTHQRFLLAQRKKENRVLCSTEEQNGEDAHHPLAEIANISTTTNSAMPPTTVHYKTSTLLYHLKSSIKICFPIEQKKKDDRKILHFGLLKELSFLLLMFHAFLLTLGVKSYFMFIPAVCVDRGLSKSQAALVLSIAGAVDMFGRIGCGFALDRARLKPHRVAIVNALVYCTAIWGFFVPFLSSFGEFVIVSTLVGTFFGAHFSQRPVMLVDLMGKELLASSFGMICFSSAFGFLAGPLICGALRDATGSYDIAFCVCSGCIVLSGISLTMSNAIFKAQQRKKERRQKKDEEKEGCMSNDSDAVVCD